MTFSKQWQSHYSDIIMREKASQITVILIVCSNVYPGADQRKDQSSASLAFVRGIHQWLVDSVHKEPVMQKMFPFDDVIIVKHKQTLISHKTPIFCPCYIGTFWATVTSITLVVDVLVLHRRQAISNLCADSTMMLRIHNRSYSSTYSAHHSHQTVFLGPFIMDMD